MKKFPLWYRSAFGALIVLWIGTAVFYAMGAEGVRVKSRSGASVTFDRDSDTPMFKIDDKTAYSISHGMVFYIKYRKAPFPYCYLCGTYETDGGINDHEGDLPGFPGVTNAHELKPDQIIQKYEPLSITNESCLIFQTAFMFLVIVMLIVGGVLLIVPKR